MRIIIQFCIYPNNVNMYSLDDYKSNRFPTNEECQYRVKEYIDRWNLKGKAGHIQRIFFFDGEFNYYPLIPLSV